MTMRLHAPLNVSCRNGVKAYELSVQPLYHPPLIELEPILITDGIGARDVPDPHPAELVPHWLLTPPILQKPVGVLRRGRHAGNGGQSCFDANGYLGRSLKVPQHRGKRAVVPDVLAVHL